MKEHKARQYLALARGYADRFSKDRSTKVGAFFVDPSENLEIARGYNGFPRGCRDDIAARHDRPAKYDYAEHAERNAIYNVVRADLRSSIVVATEVPTVGCIRAVIAVGASELYFPAPALTGAAAQSHERGLELLAEAGVKVGHIRDGRIESGSERHSRKLTQNLADACDFARVLAKDPTPTAAYFVSPDDYTVLATGCSGFVRGMDDSRQERYLGEQRTLWVEGAIRNAIFSRARRHLRNAAAMVTFAPCAECARAMAACGVKSVYAPTPTAEELSRWQTHLMTARELLEELGIRFQTLDIDRADSPLPTSRPAEPAAPSVVDRLVAA